MKKRLTKSEIYRKCNILKHELYCLEGKKQIGTGNYRYNYYSINNRISNYKIWEAIAIEGIKKPDRYSDEYKEEGFLTDENLLKTFPKYATVNKSYNPHYLYLDYNTKDLLRRKFTDKIEIRITAITKEISKLNTLKYNLIGRNKKQNVGDNLAELVIKGCTLPLDNMRFCSPTGREVKINFDMFKFTMTDRGYSRYNTDKVSPKTPAEIGLHRLRGFVFDAEQAKLQFGREWSYHSVEHYVKTNYRRGILEKFDKEPSNQELADIVTNWKAQIKDTIWCKYLDSATHKNYPLKFKEIFLYVTESKRIDKKRIRVSRALDTAMKEHFKAHPITKNNYYNIPCEEVSLRAREILKESKDRQFCKSEYHGFVYNYISDYINKATKDMK